MKQQPPFQDEYDPIVDRLRHLPELDPPAGLRSGIMASLTPKTPGVWTRFSRFLFQPRTVTFVPIKWAPVLAGLLMLAVIPRLGTISNFQEQASDPLPVKQAALTFTFEDPDARHVALIGTFNRWVPDGQVKTEKQGNRWIFRIDVAPGRYEYAFLVDGREVVPDPRAVFRRDNGFGVANSIVFATANGQNNI